MSSEVTKYFEHISEIEEKLLLGDITGACNNTALREVNIKMVISIIDYELPNERKSEAIEYHHLLAEDRQDEDLLTHFPNTCALIGYGQSKGLNVLVHCRAGVSRSATIVMAFLMNKYQISYSKARQMVARKRPQISVNPGFQIQLNIFEAMNFHLDPNNRQFRRYLLDFLLFNPRIKNSINSYFDRRQYCESLRRVNYGNSCLCAGCGQKLFSEIHVIKRDLSENAITQSTDSNVSKVCEDMYIEPQFWLKDRLKEVFKNKDYSNTEVKCPTCSSKLGSFNPNFKLFECNCSSHKNLFCLYIKVKNNKIKINVK